MLAMRMEVVVLPCPDCGQKIFISNPIQGKPVNCGGCGAQLKLARGGSSSPEYEYAVGGLVAGLFISWLLTVGTLRVVPR